VEDGPDLVASTATAFRLGTSVGEFVRGVDGRVTGLRLEAQGGLADPWRRVDEVAPGREQLGAYAGRYRSDEAEAELVVALEDGRLVLKQRPDSVRPLRPTYADAFATEGRDVRFLRDAGGRVVALSLSTGRLWDLRFERTGR
jgi:hypothetical protein